MEPPYTLSVSSDLTLSHQRGQIRIYGHSTEEGLVIRADSPQVLKAALRTANKTWLRTISWRKTLKKLRTSPQSLEIKVRDRTLLAIGADRVRIHYVRLLPYLPSLL